MEINSLEALKKQFAEFKELFSQGKAQEAAALLEELLEALKQKAPADRAGQIDLRGNISAGKRNPTHGGTEQSRQECIHISLNHVMEYYIYDYYFKPACEVRCTGLAYAEYYRTYGDLCMQLGRYKAAEAAYRSAIEWNPVDLDAILGLAETCKYLNMLERYLLVTKQAYRYCCTRATMARYYRNMGYYYLAKYEPELARACYCYSNIYYPAKQADNELKYLETALKDKTPEYTIPEMQQMFDAHGIEPGPESDTIGVIYQVGERMMQDKEMALAKDCFSIVYDITQEKALKELLDKL